MALDVGLNSGLTTLWEQQTLFDFVIEVEDQEIPVHKVVMASVSDYFRVMLSGPMLETSTNRVKLQGQSAAAVAKLIELVYTGSADIVKENALDILGPAVYFQMTKITEACVKRLQQSLSVTNCLDVLSAFVRFSLTLEVARLKSNFLRLNCSAAIEHYKPDDTPYEALEIIIEYCTKSEWDLFLMLKYWVSVDYENRKVHVNDLMSQIRFGLMSQGQVAAITEMDIFRTSDDPWGNLVRDAVKYHETPTHQRVLDASVQAKARSPPVLVMFNTCEGELGSFDCLPAKDGPPEWGEDTALQAPVMGLVTAAIEVNNFLVVCGEYDGVQQWHIFDPRTKTWSSMSGMAAAKDGFALTHHEEKLYVLGGHKKGSEEFPGLKSFTADVEHYNLSTDTWHNVNKMAAPVTQHAACTYGDLVYVSGGWRETDGKGTFLKQGTTDVECLDPKTGVWKKTTPVLRRMQGHQMFNMTVLKQKVIMAVDRKFHMEYYQPVCDQWTNFQPDFGYRRPGQISWGSNSVMVGKGNVLYLINVRVPMDIEEYSEDSDADEESVFLLLSRPRRLKNICIKWRVHTHVVELDQTEFSRLDVDGAFDGCDGSKEMFGALLSLSN